MSLVERRYLYLTLAATIIFGVADLILLRRSDIIIIPENAIELALAIPVVAFFFVGARVIRARKKYFPDDWDYFLRACANSIEGLGLFQALFVPLSVCSCLFMYLAADTDRPLMDVYLASVDTMFGFDWVYFVKLANGIHHLAVIFVFCYATVGYQIIMVVLIHALANRRSQLLEFLAMLAISGLLTGLAMLAVPAEGAYAFYKPAVASFDQFTATGGLDHLSTLAALRSPEPFEYLISRTIGLTCFPSYHTVLGLILTYSLRRTIWFIPAFAVNAVMILATVPEGGHYLVEVVAGAVLGTASILFVTRMAHWNLSPTVTSFAHPV